jgi:hypothetical protein
MNKLGILFFIFFNQMISYGQELDVKGKLLLEKEFNSSSISMQSVLPFLTLSDSLLNESDVVYIVVTLETNRFVDFLGINENFHLRGLNITEEMFSKSKFRNIFLEKRFSYLRFRNRFNVSLYYFPCR